jgi:hypothetical protein
MRAWNTCPVAPTVIYLEGKPNVWPFLPCQAATLAIYLEGKMAMRLGKPVLGWPIAMMDVPQTPPGVVYPPDRCHLPDRRHWSIPEIDST